LISVGQPINTLRSSGVGFELRSGVFLALLVVKRDVHDAVSHRLLFAFACALTLACTTTPERDGTGAVLELGAPDPALPDWLGAPASITRDPQLEEAAILLCARDTDGVIDDDARHAAHIAEGQVLGMLRKGITEDDAGASLARDVVPLLVSSRITHAGTVRVQAHGGGTCAAVVGVRRVVAQRTPLATSVPSKQRIDVDVVVPAERVAVLYVTKPDGFVARFPVGGEGVVSVPTKADGRYVLEVLVDNAKGPRDPEVALFWPVLVGQPSAKEPPFPAVLFPDEGHDDAALTHRAEALLQRLRNEQLIEPFKVSPALLDVAAVRAQAVAQRGTLGHRVDNIDPREELRIRYGDEPRAQFLRFAEVQASGSTLADAWAAMLDSPAHRYELVDTSFTHCGVGVARGKDAAGRATVTMVALLGRRPPNRDPDTTRATILGAANEARETRGLDALVESAHLNRVAMRLAGAMRDARKLDDTLLGGPIAQVAIEADASLNKVKPLVARNDDPLLLLANGVPPMLLEMDTAQAGVGIALDADAGAFYVVVLAAE
jgi:uncharacterized protein YkwD